MSRCPHCGTKECCGADLDPELERLRLENAELKRQLEERDRAFKQLIGDDAKRSLSTGQYRNRRWR